MEEIRCERERQSDLADRVSTEERQGRRHREHVNNLKENARDLDGKLKNIIMSLGGKKDKHNLSGDLDDWNGGNDSFMDVD